MPGRIHQYKKEGRKLSLPLTFMGLAGKEVSPDVDAVKLNIGLFQGVCYLVLKSWDRSNYSLSEIVSISEPGKDRCTFSVLEDNPSKM